MTVQQSALFHDDINDAIGAVIQACGGNKRVAGELWHTLKPETAYARLRSCLNPEKPEKLSPEELLWLARRGRDAGCHALVEYICDHAGYERPRPRTPEEQRDEAIAATHAATQTLSRALALLERVAGVDNQHTHLRGVRR